MEATDARNAARRRKLEDLNAWRNAIAHHDIDSRRPDLHPREVTLDACRGGEASGPLASVTGGRLGKAPCRASTLLGGLEEATKAEFGVTP